MRAPKRIQQTRQSMINVITFDVPVAAGAGEELVWPGDTDEVDEDGGL